MLLGQSYSFGIHARSLISVLSPSFLERN